MIKLLITILSVALAVGLFTALWVGLNKVFDQAEDHWSRFSALIGGLAGFVLFSLMHGNRLITTFPGIETTREALTWGGQRDPVTFVGDLVTLMWWAIPGAFIGAAGGWVLSRTKNPRQRLLTGVALGITVGLIFGFTLKTRYLPGLKLVPMLAWPIVSAAVGFGLGSLRRKSKPLTWALGFASVGWICGTFGIARLGIGTRAEAVMVMVVAGLGIGAMLGCTGQPNRERRTIIDQNSRAWLFMGPALLFIAATLVIPGLITLVLSFRDNAGEHNVWFDNYVSVFRATDVNGVRGWNAGNFDLNNWSDLFSTRLLWMGVVLIIVGLAAAAIQGKRTGRTADFSPQSGGLAAAGFVFLMFAMFSVLRGTVINNLWWVFTVTLFSTGMGLAIATWSDGARGERLAKSIIFMPMAISFVGASIIWRFMYRPQEVSKSQTGFLNAVWVWLGSKTAGAAPTKGAAPDYDPDRYSNLGIGIFDFELFNFNARPLFVVLLVGIAVVLAYQAYRTYPAGQEAGSAVWLLVSLAFVYLAYRTGTEGIGGYAPKDDGSVVPQTVLFRETAPFNSFWLMVVLLWIETGFAMVILSAAIKAVPAEFIEAAKIDGADDSQIFWRITIPQIAPTIGVVVTTVIVRVTKVYDIVAVMTGGNFDTNVLANEMIDQSFQFGNFGQGAALAIILFAMVLPVMYLNIRRMNQEATV